MWLKKVGTKMTIEEFKNSLLDIIKEAANLPGSDIEMLPHTSLPIKKGRLDEFKANARFYYQLKNNQAVISDDYIPKVYEELSRELVINEKKQSVSSSKSNSLTRLEVLQKTWKLNRRDYEKYQKALTELKRKDEANPRIWKEITSLQDSLQTLATNELRIKNAIAQWKDKINNETRMAIEKRMELIKSRYDPTSHEKDFGLDGSPVLSMDKEEYDNLYLLHKIIENVNEKDPLIGIANILCVNPNQVASATELLTQTKFLPENQTRNLNPDMIKEPQLLDINKELKVKIINELKSLIKKAKDHPDQPRSQGKEVLDEDLNTYQLLAKAYEILSTIYDTDTLIGIGQAQIPITKVEEYKAIVKKLSNNISDLPAKTSPKNKEVVPKNMEMDEEKRIEARFHRLKEAEAPKLSNVTPSPEIVKKENEIIIPNNEILEQLLDQNTLNNNYQR